MGELRRDSLSNSGVYGGGVGDGDERRVLRLFDQRQPLQSRHDDPDMFGEGLRLVPDRPSSVSLLDRPSLLDSLLATFGRSQYWQVGCFGSSCSVGTW